SGLNEERLTEIKEQKKLQITIEYAQKQLEILRAVAREAPTDELTEQILDLEITIQESQKRLAEIGKNGQKFDLLGALLPGLNPDEISALKEGISRIYDEILGVITESIDRQIEQNQ